MPEGHAVLLVIRGRRAGIEVVEPESVEGGTDRRRGVDAGESGHGRIEDLDPVVRVEQHDPVGGPVDGALEPVALGGELLVPVAARLEPAAVEEDRQQQEHERPRSQDDEHGGQHAVERGAEVEDETRRHLVEQDA